MFEQIGGVRYLLAGYSYEEAIKAAGKSMETYFYADDETAYQMIGRDLGMLALSVIASEAVKKVKEARFTLVRGKEIGRGSVEEVKEVYLEKENLDVIKDKEVLKSIIGYAEQLSCALIYEDVYGLIE